MKKTGASFCGKYMGFKTNCKFFYRVGKSGRPICKKGKNDKEVAFYRDGIKLFDYLADCQNCGICPNVPAKKEDPMKEMSQERFYKLAGLLFCGLCLDNPQMTMTEVKTLFKRVHEEFKKAKTVGEANRLAHLAKIDDYLASKLN